MKIRHPLFNQTYELQSDGLVRVEDTDTGDFGTFDSEGRPIEGTMKSADPEMLLWVGGKPHK